MVNDVEQQVDRAADGTAQGLKQLRAANRAAKSYNACWIYGCGCGLVSVVLAVLYFLWPSITGGN